MNPEQKQFLIDNRLGLLETTGCSQEQIELYEKFQFKFNKLFEFKAEIYNIENPIFYIKGNLTCNAFARRINGHNVIGITQGYPILMNRKFNKELFEKIIFAAFLNEKDVSDAFSDLYESTEFKFENYMLDCSIQYTFSHEFRHILQFNSLNCKGDLFFSENFSVRKFDRRKHVWEYDADKIAAHEVVLFALSVYRGLENKTVGNLKCLLCCALASLVITKCLFYFGVVEQLNQPYQLNITDFYTEENWHPHHTVRALNLFDSFYLSIEEGLPHIELNRQTLLNNCLGIAKLYFDVLFPNSDVGKLIFSKMFECTDEANKYNDILHNYALYDESIKALIKKRTENIC